MENNQVKLRWPFKVQTDHQTDHNRPDVVVLEKAGIVYQIIDVACSFDTRIAEKEREKTDHYQDLKVEIQTMCGAKDVGALGVVTKNLMPRVTKNTRVTRNTLLGIAKILRRILET